MRGGNSGRRRSKIKTQIYIYSCPEISGSVYVLSPGQHVALNKEMSPSLTKILLP